MAEKTVYDGGNSDVLSSWGNRDNGVLREGSYKSGSVLGKNADGNLELATDATKAEAILLEDIEVAAGKTRNAPTLKAGIYAEDAVVLGGALTIDDVRTVLENLTIYMKKRG